MSGGVIWGDPPAELSGADANHSGAQLPGSQGQLNAQKIDSIGIDHHHEVAAFDIVLLQEPGGVFPGALEETGLGGAVQQIGGVQHGAELHGHPRAAHALLSRHVGVSAGPHQIDQSAASEPRGDCFSSGLKGGVVGGIVHDVGMNLGYDLMILQHGLSHVLTSLFFVGLDPCGCGALVDQHSGQPQRYLRNVGYEQQRDDHDCVKGQHFFGQSADVDPRYAAGHVEYAADRRSQQSDPTHKNHENSEMDGIDADLHEHGKEDGGDDKKNGAHAHKHPQKEQQKVGQQQ